MTMVVVVMAVVMTEVAVVYVSTNAGMETVVAMLLVLTDVHAVLAATSPGVGGQADRRYKSEHQHNGKRPDPTHFRPGHVLCSFSGKQRWYIEKNT